MGWGIGGGWVKAREDSEAGVSRTMRFIALLVLALTTAPYVHAETITGKVVGIADGDTITVLDTTKTQHKIRLDGIDAPEGGQAFSAKSKKALSGKIHGKDVRIEYEKRDRYGRILGQVYLGDRLINKEMVSEGFAWHYKKYSSDKALADAEVTARTAKAGLWSEAHPTPPWEFRTGKKAAKAKAEYGTDAKYWLNTGGGVRHNEGCRWYGKTKRGRECREDEGKACGRCGG